MSHCLSFTQVHLRVSSLQPAYTQIYAINCVCVAKCLCTVFDVAAIQHHISPQGSIKCKQPSFFQQTMPRSLIDTGFRTKVCVCFRCYSRRFIHVRYEESFFQLKCIISVPLQSTKQHYKTNVVQPQTNTIVYAKLLRILKIIIINKNI